MGTCLCERGRSTLVNREIWESSPEKAAFEKRLVRGEDMSQEAIWRNYVKGQGNSKCKGPEAWHIPETGKRLKPNKGKSSSNRSWVIT